jgi:membrane complex biogenesis BtpA family protein
MKIKKNSFLSQDSKPVIGMVHLGGLPGSVHFNEPFARTLQRALEEAKILVEAGFDALLFQNTGDVPALEEGDEATVAFMTAAGIRIKEICPVPVGVNVLMNGSKAAFAIARAIGADFVRIKINIGAVATSTGIVEADPHEILAFRNRIGAREILILGDVYDRTSAPVGEFPLPVLADLAIRHADVDALVVSGYDASDTQARLKLLRVHLPGAALVAGGGVNINNLGEFLQLTDAIIVGSSIKTGGNFLDRVDAHKADEFMKAARTLRGR